MTHSVMCCILHRVSRTNSTSTMSTVPAARRSRPRVRPDGTCARDFMARFTLLALSGPSAGPVLARLHGPCVFLFERTAQAQKNKSKDSRYIVYSRATRHAVFRLPHTDFTSLSSVTALKAHIACPMPPSSCRPRAAAWGPSEDTRSPLLRSPQRQHAPC
jgi:hypothetical protein